MKDRKRVISDYGLLIIDMISIIVAYNVALILRFSTWELVEYKDAQIMMCVLIMLFGIITSIIFAWDIYYFKRGMLSEFLVVLKINILLLVFSNSFIFIFKRSSEVSRLVIGIFIALNIIISWSSRVVLKRGLIKYFGAEHSRIKFLIMCNTSVAHDTVRQIIRHKEVGYEAVGVILFQDTKSEKLYSTDDNIEGIKIIGYGGNKNYQEQITTLPFDEVFLFLPNEKRSVRDEIMDIMEDMGVIYHYNIDYTSHRSEQSQLSNFCHFTVMTHSGDIQDNRKLIIKRVMDIIGSLIGILITIVLFPIIAIAIRLESKGDIIFSQVRIGKNGRRFKIYKFRSMYTDAEERKKDLELKNEMQGLMFKMKDDPRITKVGRLIRKMSIDELPQFLNILKGDMSLVGTRPPTEDEFRQYSPYYRRRISMTPGLTGMWQIKGRGRSYSFDEVVAYDLEYIDNWSLTLDIKILLQTVWVVVTGKGAV